MVVRQFHIERVTQFPAKINRILVIHADAVLPKAITF